MKTNIKIDEITKEVNSQENLNKAIEILSLLDGNTVEECEMILGVTRKLLYDNTIFYLPKD